MTFYGASNLVRHSMGLVDGDFNIAGTAATGSTRVWRVRMALVLQRLEKAVVMALIFNNDAGTSTATKHGPGGQNRFFQV